MSSRRLHGDGHFEDGHTDICFADSGDGLPIASAPFVHADSGARQETQLTVTGYPIDVQEQFCNFRP